MPSKDNLSLFISAISAITNTQVITYDDYLKSYDDGDNNSYNLLKHDDLFKFFLPKILELGN